MFFDNSSPKGDRYLNKIHDLLLSLIEPGFLGESLRRTRSLLRDMQFDSFDSRLEELQNNYTLMCDFMARGYKDEKRGELYKNILGQLYQLLQDIALRYRMLNDDTFRGYSSYGFNYSFDVESLRQHLEAFVSDVAMTSLDTGSDSKAKAHRIYEDHFKYMQTMFNVMVFSPQWSRQLAESMVGLITSPTADTGDLQLLVSGIGLGALLSEDPERTIALINIYEKSLDMHVKQRALVGWAMMVGVDSFAIFDRFDEALTRVTSRKEVRDELRELQIQMVYCANAKRDNERLQKDIMPTLMRGQDFEIRGGDVKEKDDNALADMLHPDEAERKMEEMEQGLQKMMDMRNQGVDIYFGGFSQMKRFSFFFTLPNWFMPFSPDHPQLQHLDADFLESGVVKSILKSGAFCDSDKYSFVLGTSTVFRNLPANIREMLNSGEVSLAGIGPQDVDIHSATYVRRMYLQDVYRFFSLCDARKMFDNPFSGLNYLFMVNNYLPEYMQQEGRRVKKFLLKQKMYDAFEEMSSRYGDLNNEEDLNMEAAAHMHRGNYAHAHNLYLRLIDKDPDNQRTLLGLAQTSFRLGDYDEATEYYERLHDLQPNNRSVALNLAISQINSGEADEALKLLYKLDYEEPDNPNVKRAIAWGSLWEGKTAQAKSFYKEAIAKDKQVSSDYLNLAYCHWFDSEVAEAIDAIVLYFKHTGGSAPSTSEILDILEQDEDLLNVHGIQPVERMMMAELVKQKMG